MLFTRTPYKKTGIDLDDVGVAGFMMFLRSSSWCVAGPSTGVGIGPDEGVRPTRCLT